MIVFKGSHVQYLKEQEGLHREKSRSSNADQIVEKTCILYTLNVIKNLHFSTYMFQCFCFYFKRSFCPSMVVEWNKLNSFIT